MLDNLTANFSNLVKTLRGNARLTETNIQETLHRIQQSLLEADVAVSVVKNFIARIKEQALNQQVLHKLTPGQMLVNIVREALIELLGSEKHALNLATVPPATLLMAGLQGSGKTTTAAKLAYLLKKQKKKILLASVDIYRPAAIEQLKLLAEQSGVAYFESDVTQSVIVNAQAVYQHAKRYFFDALIVDTAGRLAIDQAMMDEIKLLHATLKPIETLFVLDAMQGQDAANTAQAFNQALPLTGLVVTKMDGDARGGAALSVREMTGKPIKFMGTSEKIDGLELFYPERLAHRILGMGDVLSLIDDLKKGVSQPTTAAMATKIKSGKSFDLEDFKQQMLQIKSMGGAATLLEKMPHQLMQSIHVNQRTNADKQISLHEAIINSMTLEEKRYPEIIKASRKRRIAKGSGTTVQSINQLLEQFEQMQKMMKQFSKGGLGKLMHAMKNKLPFSG